MSHLGSYEDAIRTLMTFEDNVAKGEGTEEVRTSVLLGIRGCIEKLMSLRDIEYAQYEKDMKEKGEPVDEPGAMGY